MWVRTPGFWGTRPEQVLRGTVLFYPCSHMNSNSVFTGTGPELIPWIPGIHPGIHPGDVMMFIMMFIMMIS